MEKHLLRQAIENSSTQGTLDSEKQKKFLQDLDPKQMKALFDSPNADINRMKEIIAELDSYSHNEKFQNLCDVGKEQLERICILFDELNFLCELTHNANALEVLNGLHHIVSAINLKNPNSILKSSMSILATSMPNNPVFQSLMLKYDLQPSLIEIFNETECGDVCRVATHCISSFVRNFEPGLELFKKSNTFDDLIKKFNSSQNLRLKHKIAFVQKTFLHNEFEVQCGVKKAERNSCKLDLSQSTQKYLLRTCVDVVLNSDDLALVEACLNILLLILKNSNVICKQKEKFVKGLQKILLQLEKENQEDETDNSNGNSNNEAMCQKTHSAKNLLSQILNELD